MWSLGKVMETPEVCRVYVGSYWEQPPQNPDTAQLINAEMEDLLNDLRVLPRQGALRKVNELVKRVRGRRRCRHCCLLMLLLLLLLVLLGLLRSPCHFCYYFY